MKGYTTYIYLDKTRNYRLTGYENYLDINVNTDDPFDKLSGLFQKYTHLIKYSEEPYSGADHTIYLYNEKRWFFKYILTYDNPTIQVKSVDIFFSTEDKKNETPLVIGFNENTGEDTIYYTYLYLKGLSSVSKSLPRGFFRRGDLMTRLLEERNLNEGKTDHLLINTKLRPSSRFITYPQTGVFTNRITVLKIEDASYCHRYEHKFHHKKVTYGININFDYDVLLIQDDIDLFRTSNLISVEVCYQKLNLTNPFIIFMRFQTNFCSYITFSDFKSTLGSSSKVKKISNLNHIVSGLLSDFIVLEFDKYNLNLSYSVEQTKRYSHRIEFKEEPNIPNEGFTKYTHTPESYHRMKQWYVIFYGDALMTMDRGNYKKIEGIQEMRYKQIIVYFGDKQREVPLLVGLFPSLTSNPPQYYSHHQDSGVLYWNVFNLPTDDSNNRKLTNELENLESELVPSVPLLINKRRTYGNPEIDDALTVISPHKKINALEIDKNNIRVKNTSDKYSGCSAGYRIYEHDVSTLPRTDSSIRLRILIRNNGTYSEISLFNDHYGDNKNNTEYLYYTRGNNLYVFFPEKDDRPILICYYGSAYIPKSKDDYNKVWAREIQIVQCPCPTDNLVINILKKACEMLGIPTTASSGSRSLAMSGNRSLTTGGDLTQGTPDGTSDSGQNQHGSDEEDGYQDLSEDEDQEDNNVSGLGTYDSHEDSSDEYHKYPYFTKTHGIPNKAEESEDDGKGTEKGQEPEPEEEAEVVNVKSSYADPDDLLDHTDEMDDFDSDTEKAAIISSCKKILRHSYRKYRNQVESQKKEPDTGAVKEEGADSERTTISSPPEKNLKTSIGLGVPVVGVSTSASVLYVKFPEVFIPVINALI